MYRYLRKQELNKCWYWIKNPQNKTLSVTQVRILQIRQISMFLARNSVEMKVFKNLKSSGVSLGMVVQWKSVPHYSVLLKVQSNCRNVDSWQYEFYKLNFSDEPEPLWGLTLGKTLNSFNQYCSFIQVCLHFKHVSNNLWISLMLQAGCFWPHTGFIPLHQLQSVCQPKLLLNFPGTREPRSTNRESISSFNLLPFPCLLTDTEK